MQGKGPVYLMAATLRPETMAGQTNCWVLPEGDYGAYRCLSHSIPACAFSITYTIVPRKSVSEPQSEGK